jgi:glycerophosphoryl diester phosphodiesterase
MTGRRGVQITMAALLVVVAPGLATAGRERPHHLAATAEALLALDVRPVAIGHRGSGANDPTHASRPIENTVTSVRKAFEAGLTVIEIDVQLTRDRHVVAYHDDVLSGTVTCINTLTLRELKARLPFIPTLQAVLDEARRFNQPAGPLRGIVIIELKAARPLCDPEDRQDRPMVDAATHVVRHMRMTQQVLFTSFSPAMLELARIHAPEIARILAVSGLQFLTEEEAAEQFDTTVTLIEKRHGVGLRWAEIGTLFRLPGYRCPAELVRTALAVDARVVEADLLILLLDPDAKELVQGLHDAGLKVFGFTVDDATQWTSLASLGVDAIYTNDIDIGLALQAFVP